MKKLIARYWGIALVLAVLAGLLVPAMPVSAGDTAWSGVATPSVGGGKLTANTNVSFLQMAADGTTMFVYDNVGKTLMKSADGGMTWSGLGYGAGLNTKTLTALAISSGFATDNTLVAADFAAGAAVVYMSTDGGKNWFSPIVLPVATAAVATLAVGPDYQGGTRVLVGTSTGAGGGALYSWISRTFTITTEAITNSAGGGGDVVAAAMSPNFLGDGELLAVVANATVTELHAKLAANAWDLNTGRVGFTGIVAAVGMTAVMDFGADYAFSGNAYVLVGFSGSASDDLWRANIGTAAALAADMGIGGAATVTPVYSVDVKGNITDGTVYVGYAANAGVASATGLTGGAVWTGFNAKGPSGTNSTIVKVTAAGLIAGTSGVGSAISMSTDNNVTYNMVSLISFSNLATLAFTDLKVVDSNTMFLLAKDGAYSVVFKTTSAGATWSGVYNNSAAPAVGVFGVFPSPAYATDSTLYVPLDNLTVRKSVNGGNSYTTAIVGGVPNVTAFAAVDGTNFFVGSAGGLIYKSGRFVNFATLPAPETATSIVVASNGDVVAGGSAGNVYRSTDDGVTFASLGAGGVGAITVALDSAYATNKVVYAGSTTGVSRYDVAWTAISGASTAAAIVVSNDGNLYYGGAAGGVKRALNPTTPDQGWDVLPVAVAQVAKLGIVNTLLSGTAWQHDIYALQTGVAGDATYPYTARIMAFSDKLTNPMAISTPAANATVSTTQQITWAAYPGLPAGTGILYDVQIAQDAAFTLGVQNSNAQLGTLWTNPVLLAGTTYYVRVRVTAANPLLSNWSPAVKFSVKLVQAGNDIIRNVAPVPGATDVALKPAFQWTAVDRAVSYNLQVADNPVFVNPLDNQTGLNTNVWLETKTLDPGKTYYWRVQAVAADGTTSDWFQFTFSTAAPVPTTTVAPTTVTTTAAPITLPAQTVTLTPPAAPKFFDPISGLYFNTQSDLQQYQAQHPSATPSTPAYIWVIIVIGAVLVIAVIVLIARTRRV
jgi:trimeric autotransporter adhesin